MQRVEILLPLFENGGKRNPKRRFDQTTRELTEKFGGLTAYTRAPAHGFWKQTSKRTVRDDVVIYEVICPRLNRSWWKRYRSVLEHRFAQDELIVRAQRIEIL
jgi:hypothetical protein